ncbi:MAG TPA: glycosyltransferase [Stellaceae bacterium]|nr:glycosyltransferase [Stellaceae bacterium]
MSYRVFRLCISGPYYKHFFAFADSVVDLSFDQSMQRCREQGFVYPGRFKAEMERHGAEVFECLIDLPALQRKWMRENGHGEDVFDRNDVFFRQLKAFKPDIVYFQTFLALAPEVRKRIKAECPSVRIVCGHRGFPIDDCAGYEDVDAAFLGYPRHHEPWHNVGVKTYFHLHCFDEGLLPAIRKRAAELDHDDFSFVGTTGWGFPPHDGRYYDLRKVLEATSLVIYGSEPESVAAPIAVLAQSVRPQLRKALIEAARFLPDVTLKAVHKAGQLAGAGVVTRGAEAAVRRKKYGPEIPTVIQQPQEFWYHKEKPIRDLYPTRIHPSLFGIEYFARLAASKVTWNRHLEIDGAGANMRLFEACGAGTCQLVDLRDEVAQAYEADKEIAVYRSVEECIEKARWLLDHPAERRAIALAGQNRTLRDHSIARRAEIIHEHFVELLARK